MVKVTYYLTAYNHEAYIADAVRSALAQEWPDSLPQPLEILISNDASTDRTLEIILQVTGQYNGPHKVRVHSNETNLGPLHYETVIDMASGEFLIAAHGDDIAEPQRARRLYEEYLNTGVSLIGSNAYVITAEGERQGYASDRPESETLEPEKIIDRDKPQLLGSTFAHHRDVVDMFPAVNPENVQVGMDVIYRFRASLLRGARYLAEPLISYRRHENNLGRRMADATHTKSIFWEGSQSFVFNSMLQNLEDLDALAARRNQWFRKRKFSRIRKYLVAKILTYGREWMTTRNHLLAEGMRPTWVTRDKLDERPISSEVRYGVRKLAEKEIKDSENE